MVRLLVSSTGNGSLTTLEATKAATKTKRRPTLDDSKVRSKSQPRSRRDGDRTANPSEFQTKAAVSKTQSSKKKEGLVSSSPEKTTRSEKPPAKTIPADQNQKSKSSMSAQLAQTKPLKVYRRHTPKIWEPQDAKRKEPKEVKSKRPQTSVKLLKKITPSKSQVSISDEATMRRSGAGNHASKLEEKLIAAIGTCPLHSTGREAIVPTVGWVDARNDESTKKDTGDKHARQDSDDSLRQPGPSSPSNSKSASSLFQGFAEKTGLITIAAQYPKHTSKVTKKGEVSDFLALTSIASVDEPVGMPLLSADIHHAANPVNRKPALAPSSYSSVPPPSKKISRSSNSNAPALLSIVSMNESVEVFLPLGTPQPCPTLLKNPAKSPAKSPSFWKGVHLATGIEASHPTKEAAAVEEKSQPLEKRKSAPVTSTQPNPGPQNPPNKETKSRLHSETVDTVKTGRTISDPATALRQAATEATERDSLVGDGASYHVRVTLGNLSGAFTSRDPSSSNSSRKDRDNSLVVGYAEMVTLASQVDSYIESVDSIPITSHMGDGRKSPFRIVWPRRKKGNPKTRNRLYFSVALKQPGEKLEHSFVRVGVRRGEQKIPLGLVRVRLGGTALERKKVDLGVQPIEPSRRKGFFCDGALDTSKHSFRDDDLIYELSDIGLLRVRIDVKKGVYKNSGPVLWHDGIRNGELDIRSPGSFLDASLQGSYLSVDARKAPSNLDNKESRFLQELCESDERNTGKKNRPVSKRGKAVPVEKSSYTSGAEKSSEGVTEERDDFNSSKTEGRDGVSRKELGSCIAARKDEVGKRPLVVPSSNGSVQVDKNEAIQRGESNTTPMTKSYVTAERHESGKQSNPAVESLVESNAVCTRFSPFDVGGHTIKAAAKRDMENNKGGSRCEALPGGDDNTIYNSLAEEDSGITENSDASCDTSAVEKFGQPSDFEMALLRLQESLSLPDDVESVIDHAASLIYCEAVRVGLYSYGSSDSTEASTTSSLNDGIRLYSCDSSGDMDASGTSRKFEKIYDISIKFPPPEEMIYDVSIELPPPHNKE
jgi:hypothetical protein